MRTDSDDAPNVSRAEALGTDVAGVRAVILIRLTSET